MFKLLSRMKALIRIAPTGSHVVLLSLVGVLALCLFSTFSFIRDGIDYCVPLAFAAVLFCAVVWLWLRSQRHLDDAPKPPITMSYRDGNTSTKVSIHLGGLRPNEQLAVLERGLSALQHRKPLPEPDGLVDEHGRPVPQSEEEARHRVEVANRVALAGTNTNADLSAVESSAERAQPALIVEPQPTQFDDTNRPSDEG